MNFFTICCVLNTQNRPIGEIEVEIEVEILGKLH